MRKLHLLAVAALALPAAALADSPADVKKAVEANHMKSMAAFEKKNIKGLMAYIADDYESVGMMGEKQNKAAIEKEMRQHVASTKKIYSHSYKVSDVKVNGNKASGKALFKLDALITDPTGSMGDKTKPHRMKMEMLYSATWKKVGGKWLTTSENAAGPPKMNIDGQDMSGGVPPPTPAGSNKAKK